MLTAGTTQRPAWPHPLGGSVAPARASSARGQASNRRPHARLIRFLVTRKKIAYVHFRNTRGVAEERFEETFIEEGKVDMLAAMRAYNDCDLDGVFIVDHTPGIVGDTGWGHRGRAYGVGYIKGLLKCVGLS